MPLTLAVERAMKAQTMETNMDKKVVSFGQEVRDAGVTDAGWRKLEVRPGSQYFVLDDGSIVKEGTPEFVEIANHIKANANV